MAFHNLHYSKYSFDWGIKPAHNMVFSFGIFLFYLWVTHTHPPYNHYCEWTVSNCFFHMFEVFYVCFYFSLHITIHWTVMGQDYLPYITMTTKRKSKIWCQVICNKYMTYMQYLNIKKLSDCPFSVEIFSKNISQIFAIDGWQWT